MTKLEKDAYSKLKEKEESFLSFDLDFLLSFERLPCDLYIELKKDTYKKVARKDDNLKKLDLNFVKEKNVKSLFVSAEEYFYGENEFRLEKLAEITDKEERDLYFNLFKDTIIDLGFSKTALEKTILYINEILKDTRNDFYKLALRFEDHKGTFLYNHSLLVSILAISYCEMNSWYNDEVSEKIILASFIHDLGFSKDTNVIFETSNEDVVERLLFFIRDEVDNHEELILSKLKDFKDISSDILQMIQYHHAKKEELESLSSTQFSELAYIFYLSHELATRIMKISFNQRKYELVLEKIIEDFSISNYKNIAIQFKNRMLEILTKETT